ncbi:MAG TPA: ABC transporter ATP-binding protein [Candidatus Saccharimonadales bacterium]|nr:ABC transporter ATP-binding protein [Candidatus Saccharimonadales bacterium]
MDGDTAISVDSVSKVFKLPREKNTSVKSAVVNFYRRNKNFEMQKALNNVSFEIKKGEFFGIVGRNGSGKSTMLKVLAGIYSPTSGAVKVEGTLTPFIELGVGFNAELTGRENVFLNGALLGFSRKEMQAMYKDIVDFAELGKFMDQKLKNYSSGMQVRLAFSIAIRAKSDILLIDEVLAVGDSAFQRKCFEHFDRLKNEKTTVILVTHDMGAVEKYCDRAILINKGELVEAGGPRDIAASYRLLNMATSERGSDSEQIYGRQVKIKSTRLNGQTDLILKNEKELKLEMDLSAAVDTDVVAGLSIIRDDGTLIAHYNSKDEKPLKLAKKTQHTIKCNINAEQFLEGGYQIDVAIYDEQGGYLDRKPNAVRFAATPKNTSKSKFGIMNLDGKWQLN